jgi:hypothetical protein
MCPVNKPINLIQKRVGIPPALYEIIGKSFGGKFVWHGEVSSGWNIPHYTKYIEQLQAKSG